MDERPVNRSSAVFSHSVHNVHKQHRQVNIRPCQDDDDVLICNDHLSDAAREDLELILRSTVSTMQEKRTPSSKFQAMVSSGVVPSRSCEFGKPRIVVESVRNISPAEFQKLQNKALSSYQSEPQQQQRDDNGNSSDSDLEILEERIDNSRQGGTGSTASHMVPLQPPPLQPFGLPRVSEGVDPNRLLQPAANRHQLPQMQRLNTQSLPARFPQPLQGPMVQLPSPQTQFAPIVMRAPCAPCMVRSPIAPSFVRPSVAPPVASTATATARAVVKLDISDMILGNIASTERTKSPLISPRLLPIYPKSTAQVANQHSVQPLPPPLRQQSRCQPAPTTLGEEPPLPVFGQNYFSLPQRSNQTKPTASYVDWSSSPNSRSSSNTSTSDGPNSAKQRSRQKRSCEQITKLTVVAGLDVIFPYEFYGRFQPGNRRTSNNDDDMDSWFFCSICDEVCITNVSFVNHVYGHFLFPSFEDEKLEHQTRCIECWRVFSDPFEMATHCDEVHSKKGNADTICFICERSYRDRPALESHMRKCHSGLDMPYSCKKCNYWSSLYADVWSHFMLNHDRSAQLMCPICLTIVNAPLMQQAKYGSKMATVITESFVAHVWQHMELGSAFTCSRCKLQFVSKSDLNNHQKVGHRRTMPVGKDDLGIAWDDMRPLAVIDPRMSMLSRLTMQKSPKPVQFTMAEADCIECKRPMDEKHHYAKSLRKCNQCSYASYCITACRLHKSTHHINLRLPPMPFEYSPFPPKRELILGKAAYCSCGYETRIGSLLAQHVQSCPTADGAIKLPRETNAKKQTLDGDRQTAVIHAKVLDALKLQPTYCLTTRKEQRLARNKSQHIPDGGSCFANDDPKLEPVPSNVQIPTSQSNSLSRPRLLDPQTLKRSHSQSSSSDGGSPSSQKRQKLMVHPSRFPKLGDDFEQRFGQWSARSDDIQNRIVSTSDEISLMIAGFESGREAMCIKYNIVLERIPKGDGKCAATASGSGVSKSLFTGCFKMM